MSEWMRIGKFLFSSKPVCRLLCTTRRLSVSCIASAARIRSIGSSCVYGAKMDQSGGALGCCCGNAASANARSLKPRSPRHQRPRPPPRPRPHSPPARSPPHPPRPHSHPRRCPPVAAAAPSDCAACAAARCPKLIPRRSPRRSRLPPSSARSAGAVMHWKIRPSNSRARRCESRAGCRLLQSRPSRSRAQRMLCLANRPRRVC
eukprot:scaffold64461_cov35-Tisochrysis_lutea.AAC.1